MDSSCQILAYTAVYLNVLLLMVLNLVCHKYLQYVGSCDGFKNRISWSDRVSRDVEPSSLVAVMKDSWLGISGNDEDLLIAG